MPIRNARTEPTAGIHECPGWMPPTERATKYACILIRAGDDEGMTGSLIQQIGVLPGTHFSTRVSTDHALYRPGDPIRVTIESDAGLTEAVVETRTASQELAGAQHVRLVNGQADVTLPLHSQVPWTPEGTGLRRDRRG
jgi:hypothetical protein